MSLLLGLLGHVRSYRSYQVSKSDCSSIYIRNEVSTLKRKPIKFEFDQQVWFARQANKLVGSVMVSDLAMDTTKSD